MKLCTPAAVIALTVAAVPVLAQPQQAQQSSSSDAAPKANTPRQSIATGNPVNPPSPATDPFASIKNPVPWFSWGADLRLRQEYQDNAYLRSSDPPGHTLNWERYRARLWDTVKPFSNDSLEINSRFTWEGWYYFNPESKAGWDPKMIMVDNLNARIRTGRDGPVPTTFTVGRQDIILGDGWLVLDGTPLDGSRTTYFDAARATLDFKSAKTTLDAIYIRQSADPDEGLADLDVAAAECKYLTEQDEQGAILYLTNKSIDNTSIEPYFIYKNDDAQAPNGDTGDVYTLGTRSTHQFSPHWQARAEGAYQFGTRENKVLFPTAGNDLSAFGANTRLTYLVKDHWDTQFYVGYEYLSGDDPHTKTNEQFDPLSGRWPQWSELLLWNNVQVTRVGEMSNLHRFNIGAQTSPTQKLTLCANYHALFADQNPQEGQPGFGDGSFRGHLFTATAKYKFNRVMSGHITGEYYLPGDFFSDKAGDGYASRQDPALFARVELVFTF